MKLVLVCDGLHWPFEHHSGLVLRQQVGALQCSRLAAALAVESGAAVAEAPPRLAPLGVHREAVDDANLAATQHHCLRRMCGVELVRDIPAQLLHRDSPEVGRDRWEPLLQAVDSLCAGRGRPRPLEDLRVAHVVVEDAFHSTRDAVRLQQLERRWLGPLARLHCQLLLVDGAGECRHDSLRSGADDEQTVPARRQQAVECPQRSRLHALEGLLDGGHHVVVRLPLVRLEPWDVLNDQQPGLRPAQQLDRLLPHHDPWIVGVVYRGCRGPWLTGDPCCCNRGAAFRRTRGQDVVLHAGITDVPGDDRRVREALPQEGQRFRAHFVDDHVVLFDAERLQRR